MVGEKRKKERGKKERKKERKKEKRELRVNDGGEPLDVQVFNKLSAPSRGGMARNIAGGQNKDGEREKNRVNDVGEPLGLRISCKSCLYHPVSHRLIKYSEREKKNEPTTEEREIWGGFGQ